MSGEQPAEITSQNNQWMKLARSLHRRKQRYRERAILVEGVRPVREAIASGTSIRAILLSAALPPDCQQASVAISAREREIRVLTVDDKLLRIASDTETPQGILAICEMPEIDPPPELPENPLVLIIDSVRDPGNVGTLMRAALGAGVDAVLLAPRTADPFAPKVIRAAAGSHFWLTLARLDWNDPPSWLRSCQIRVADANTPDIYDNLDWTGPSAIVVGNETHGPSDAAFRLAHGRVGIPLASRLESLNAGIAGSVILFEARRQRRNAGG